MFKWSSRTWLLTFVGVIALMVFSVTLFSVGFLSGQAVGARRALAQAREQVSQMFPPAPENVTSLSATVKKVDGDALLVEAAPVSANPLDPQGPTMRKVLVDNNTKVQELSFKTRDVLDADNAAYQLALSKAIKEKTALPSPPLAYISKALALGNLAPGDLVVVNAKENIRNTKEFTAIEINRTQRVAR